MEIIKLQTESYLYEDAEGQFRAFPFTELSIEEWVVYQNGEPKYLIDFNRRTKPLIKQLAVQLSSGESLETAVWKLGNFLGRNWTTLHNINGTEIAESAQSEIIELIFLDDKSDFWIPLTFIATDKIDFETLLDEEKLLAAYLPEDIREDWRLESAHIDNFDNLVKMLSFLFETEINLIQIASNINKQIFNLTQYKKSFLTPEKLELKYQNWILISGRENSMGEYANLIGIINYIHRNPEKKNLLLITENKKHWH